MININNKLQNEYDIINSYFKTTTESYNYLDWDGYNLMIWFNGNIIEEYSRNELKVFIMNF